MLSTVVLLKFETTDAKRLNQLANQFRTARQNPPPRTERHYAKAPCHRWSWLSVWERAHRHWRTTSRRSHSRARYCSPTILSVGLPKERYLRVRPKDKFSIHYRSYFRSYNRKRHPRQFNSNFSTLRGDGRTSTPLRQGTCLRWRPWCVSLEVLWICHIFRAFTFQNALLFRGSNPIGVHFLSFLRTPDLTLLLYFVQVVMSPDCGTSLVTFTLVTRLRLLKW